MAGPMLLFNPAAEPTTARPPDPVGSDEAASSSPSPRVIEAARRGDRAALALLLRALQDPWYRLSLSMLRDADAAAEAVQETGLRFLKQVAGFRGESQIRTWSLGIAINVVREMKRRRGRHLTGTAEDGDGMAQTLDDPAPLPPAMSELGEARDALQQTLSELPERQREAIVLRYFEDLSVDETARAMGCASGTVKATVHQALRSLKKRMKQWD